MFWIGFKNSDLSQIQTINSILEKGKKNKNRNYFTPH